jgi:multidrug efflux pump subunit AcrB
MWLTEFSLKRPFTVVAGIVLVCLLSVGAVTRMAFDIFPQIDIPVIAVVWNYAGMSAPEMRDRIATIYQRQVAQEVDHIARIETTSYTGTSVVRVFLHEGASTSLAATELASSALAVLKYMPRNITPPSILPYSATDVPIIQLSLSSNNLSDTALNDLAGNIIRPSLAVVRGASVTTPYGGKPRVVMADLNQEALQSRGLTPGDVSEALLRQNVILPSGNVKIGSKDYSVALNNSPFAVDEINSFPVKELNGRPIFLRDVAHVHDGYQVQTNAVTKNGLAGVLIVIRKSGGSSTLAVIDGTNEILPDLRNLLPKGVTLTPLFDQSIFVKAALNSVVMGGLMAAGLTALMILLFLGNWRLTLIIVASIPLSIICAVLALFLFGQTLNTMTLGGFALAVGILVDNSTVVIENIERHLGLDKPLYQAIMDGASEVGVPTFLATLSISVVFVPVFLLNGTAKYLFSPLSLSVIVSLCASLLLAFTLVPILFHFLMRSHLSRHQAYHPHHALNAAKGHGHSRDPLTFVHRHFERGFRRFREIYRDVLSLSVARPWTMVIFGIFLVGTSVLYPLLGMDFFPQVDAGQMRLHVRAPPATRIEDTQKYFAEVETAIRDLIGQEQIDVILDNIGLPYSSTNTALTDSATIGPMDGEILIALTEGHSSTSAHVARLRHELPKRFPELQLFFQPADIVNQVLNFGRAAPIDIRVSSFDENAAYSVATKLAHDLNGLGGIVDSHIYQVPDAPALQVNVNRARALEFGLSQQSIAANLVTSLNNSLQLSPNFWLNRQNSVSYPLVVQTPTYQINSTQDLWTLPVTLDHNSAAQMLMNVATFDRTTVPLVVSQLNIRPVFDVHADVQGRDLNSAASAIDGVISAAKRAAPKGVTITLSGQIETMRESYSGLFTGMALAVVLVFLLLVMNFQSWLDPVTVLAAVPFALAGAVWMLFLSRTHISVPALMGTLMCIGLTTANSVLVVTFAKNRLAGGIDARRAAIEAGYTRLRPVLMTAGAMILGMTPMALGVGEGGEQNAPLARAVIGGLLAATTATLILVPTVYSLINTRKSSGKVSASRA